MEYFGHYLKGNIFGLNPTVQFKFMIELPGGSSLRAGK